jgi:hypothetical protein
MSPQKDAGNEQHAMMKEIIFGVNELSISMICQHCGSETLVNPNVGLRRDATCPLCAKAPLDQEQTSALDAYLNALAVLLLDGNKERFRFRVADV